MEVSLDPCINNNHMLCKTERNINCQEEVCREKNNCLVCKNLKVQTLIYD